MSLVSCSRRSAGKSERRSKKMGEAWVGSLRNLTQASLVTNLLLCMYVFGIFSLAQECMKGRQTTTLGATFPTLCEKCMGCSASPANQYRGNLRDVLIREV